MQEPPDPGAEDVSTIGSETPRYEYRVFARVLENLGERLGEAPGLRPAGERESRETYLLGARLDRSVKLHEGRLEVKALRETREGLERWEPVASHPLPLAGAWVESELAGHLGLPGMRSGRESWDADALRAELDRPEAGLHALTVHKARKRFEAPSLMAELAEVDLGRETLESAAVESADFEAAQEAVTHLTLRRWPNTGYARCLKWFAGIEAARRAGGH